MTTFTDSDKSAAPSFSNESKASSSFTNESKNGYVTFGSLTFDQIGAYTFDGIFQGRPLGDWAFDDLVLANFWENQSKS